MRNSVLVAQNEKLVSSINVNIWNKENAESSLTDNIANKTNILIWKLATLQNSLNKEVSDFKNWWQENLKQRDYITWEKILYRDIPEKYEKLMKQEIRNYALKFSEEIFKEKGLKDKEIHCLQFGYFINFIRYSIGGAKETMSHELIVSLERACVDIDCDAYPDNLAIKFLQTIYPKKQ